MGPTRRLAEAELQTRREESADRDVDLLEKDVIERSLEAQLFGDEAGFLDALNEPVAATNTALQRTRSRSDDSLEDGEDQDVDMQDLADEDLFFLDSGSGNLPQGMTHEPEDALIEAEIAVRQPVWHDSDDERLTISLASHSRLRKLRDIEADDVITGTEYSRRLRRQYERLHPVPEWVRYARKTRKLSHNGVTDDESDADSDISLSVPSSTQSLSELLRSTQYLTRSHLYSTHKSHNRKLRPEVLDISRLKDVTASGPSSVDTLQFHRDLPLLLSGGPSSTVNLYHVSPEPPNPNPLVTSLHMKGTPLHTASFCLRASEPDQDGNSADPKSGLSTTDTRVFLSSRRRYFHTWSLDTGTISKISRALYGIARLNQKTMEHFRISPCNRYVGFLGSGKKGGGTVHVLRTATMQWVCSPRIESRGGVADFAWCRNGDGLVVVGKNGEVSEYEIAGRRVIARWQDEGAVGTTVIALGGAIGTGSTTSIGEDRWVAVGSSAGVVNIYDRQAWWSASPFPSLKDPIQALTSTTGPPTEQRDQGSNSTGLSIPLRPKPTRTLDQLTTPISHLEFSHDGQMLVMGSRWKKDALRLVHLPTCTVYRNWPTDRTPLGRVSAVAFSHDGTYLAVGNEQGRIRLWSIRE